MKTRCGTLATLTLALAASLATTLLHAKTWTQVFSQDFDDETTYTNNFYDGSVASPVFESIDTDNGTAIVGTAEQKARYGASEGEMFYFNDRNTSTTSNRALYKFPADKVAALTDYKVEFDYYLSPSVGSNGRKAGMVIKGANEAIATFACMSEGKKNANTPDCLLIWGANNSNTNTFTTGQRGANPETEYQQYWLHVTIYGNETDGVFMSVVQPANGDNGTVVLSDTRVSDFQTIDRLFFYVGYSAKSSNAKSFSLDNVVVSSGTSDSFVWTGAESDNKWTKPGNWSINDVPQTEKYPEIGDAVSGLDAAVLAAMDIGVKLETVGQTTRFVNVAPDKSMKTWSGAGENTLWTTVGNWVYTQGGFAAHEAPTGGTVEFPASFSEGVTVTMDAVYKYTAKFVVDCDVTMTSTTKGSSYNNANANFYVSSLTGAGCLKLGNLFLQTLTSEKADFATDIEILDSVTFYLRGARSAINISGALSGSGSLELLGDGNSNKAFNLSGSLSGFDGTLDIPSSTSTSFNLNGDDSTIDLSSATVNILGSSVLSIGGTYTDNALKIGALTGAGTIKNNTANAMTLEIGRSGDNASSDVVLAGTETWTVKKIGSNSQTLTDETVAYNLTLAEGEIALPVGKTLGTVAKTGGKFAFAVPGDTWADGIAHTLFTCSDGVAAETLTSADVTLDQNALTKTWLPVYDNSSANTLSVKLTEAEFVWVGGTSGRWDDDANWTVNGVAAPAAPKGGETVSIDGATVFVAPTVDMSGVTLQNDAKLALAFTDSVLSYTIPAGFVKANFVAAGPYDIAENAGVLAATRVATNFTWTGSVSSEWTLPENWSVGGGYTGVVPGTGDTAVFGTSAEVLVSASAYAGETRLDDDVTFSGEAKLQCPLWRGDGKLSLAGITLTAPTEGHFIISNDVEVVAKTTNTLTLETAASSSESDYRYIYLEGNMTGAGYLALDQRSRQGLAGGKFSGDNREFSGEIEVVNCKDNRDATQFIGAHSTSSNAVYTVYGKGDDGNSVSMFPTQNTTYYIGSIDGNVQQARSSAPGNVILEIGALNRNNSIGGHFGASNKTGIRKVGTGKLSVRASNVGDVEIVGGTYEVTGNSQSGTVKFTGNGVFRSTIAKSGSGDDIDYALKLDGSENYPIVFDDGGLERTWATAIKASNKAGFTKKGSGTLTLEKAPLYTGLTTVDDGKIIFKEAPDDLIYNAFSAVPAANGIQGATVTKYAYPENTTLVYDGTETTFDSPLDVSNVTKINLSGVTLVNGTTYTIVSATAIAGYSKGAIKVVLPEGADATKWVLRRSGNALVLAPKGGFLLVIK